MNIGAILLALEGQHEGRALTAEGQGVAGLLTVANRPLLQQAADLLAAAGVRDLVVASSASVSGAVRRAVGDGSATGQRIQHVEVPVGTGPLAAALEGRTRLGDGPVVLHGDDSLVLGGMSEAVTCFRDQELDALQLAMPAALYAPAREDNGAVALRHRPRPLGVQILGDRAIEVLEDLEAQFGPAVTLDELPAAVKDRGGRVQLEDQTRAWRFSGDVDSFLEANRMVLDRLAVDVLAATPGMPWSQAGVVVDPTAQVRGTKLRGPLIIGPEACVKDSYVGPYTCIGAGARLEGAEIEHSVVLPEASVCHVGQRIEDSVIGTGARIDRTFAMPTALRLQVGPGARVSLS